MRYSYGQLFPIDVDVVHLSINFIIIV